MVGARLSAEGSYMRRFVTALVLIVAAFMLAACAAAPTDNGGAPTPNVPVTPSGGGASQMPTDILSPTVPVGENEMFPTDEGSVPSAVLANIKAKKPMLVYFYDPTTQVSANQRKEIDAALKSYVGMIELVTFDYTVGLSSAGATITPSAELDKAELMIGVLKVKTTPYLIFVDRNGRITYKFAGFVDRDLIEREVLRATE